MKTMSRLIPLIFAFFLYNEVYGSDNRVDFKVNSQGYFYRTDFSKNYYVFELKGLSATAIEKLFNDRWRSLRSLPPYFESSYRVSSYIKSNEAYGLKVTIEGVIDNVSIPGFGENDSYSYDYSIIFIDGRYRINAPTIYVNKPGAITDAAKKALAKVGNNIINDLLIALDREKSEEIELARKRASTKIAPNMAYFRLSDYCSFETVDSSDYVAFQFDGLTKEQIKRGLEANINGIVVRQGFTERSFYDEVEIYNYDEALQIYGWQNISISGRFMTVDVGQLSLGGYPNCRALFQYEVCYACFDGLVVVFLPKIKKVSVSYPGKVFDTAYDSLEEFLLYNHICDWNGKLKRKGKKNLKDINSIETTFNTMIFAPIYNLKESLNKKNEVDVW